MADSVPAATAVDDFEAAKVIAERLKDLPRDRQERVLRWVAESLGIVNPTAPKPASSPAPPPAEPRPHTPAPERTPAPRHASDIRSFVTQKQPQTDIQYVTVAAYYFRFEAPESERRSMLSSPNSQRAWLDANV